MIKSIIFSAPSASGKTTIVKHIIKKFPKIRFSISATTREIRPGEIDGRDYHFISPDKFKEMIINKEFIEYEEVYKDQFYGTLVSEVNKIWDDGGIVIYDMDVVGGLNLKNKFGDESLSFFVKVPTIEELGRRLKNRNTESEEKIKMRIDKAKSEILFENKFDKIIVNDELEKTLNEVEKIIGEFI